MNDRDESNKTSHLALSKTMVNGRTDPRGAIIEMGVTAGMLTDILNNKRRVYLLCIDNEAFTSIEKEPCTGLELIAKERQEQIEKHGYTVEHDKAVNANNELLQAANALLFDGQWPSNWNSEAIQHMMDKPLYEKVLIVGAWMAAWCDSNHKQFPFSN